MKQLQLKTFFFILLFGFSLISQAQTSENSQPLAIYKWKTEIQGETQPGELTRIQLPFEILNQSSHHLNDLILLDENQKVVPFVIKKSINEFARPKISILKVINYKESENKSIIELENSEKLKWISRIEFSTYSHNFNKKVMIYEGIGNHKKIVAEDKIFDFTMRVNLRKIEIKLPDIKSQFITIELIDTDDPIEKYPDIKFYTHGVTVENNKFKIKIDRFIAHQNPIQKTKNILDEIKLDKLDMISEPRKTFIKLGKMNFNLHEISFQIKNPENFYRQVYILSASEDQSIKNYYSLKQDVIYNLPLDKPKLEVELNRNLNSYVAIEIRNDDNEPLDIENIKLKWAKTYVYFIPNQSKKYHLYFDQGSHPNRQKKFDLNYILGTKSIPTPKQTFTTGKVVPNTLYDPALEPDEILRKKDFKEKIILGVIVGILSIGIIFWLMSLLKKIPRD